MTTGDGIAAYDVPQRIASYEADMDIMHPNRHTMVEVALRFLPFERDHALQVLDLGVGMVRLDVIDTNHGAQRLYERSGFVPLRIEKFPYLRWLLGFGASTTMEFRIADAA